MPRKTILHLCILIILPSLLQAKDLGVHGRVYEIKENGQAVKKAESKGLAKKSLDGYFERKKQNGQR